MQKFLIRFFDLVISLLGLIVLTPFFIIVALLIVMDSKGGVLYRQSRVGEGGR